MNDNLMKKVGELRTGVWAKRYHQICAVFSPQGISPTITAGGGGGTEVKIIERTNPIRNTERPKVE